MAILFYSKGTLGFIIIYLFNMEALSPDVFRNVASSRSNRALTVSSGKTNDIAVTLPLRKLNNEMPCIIINGFLAEYNLC